MLLQESASGVWCLHKPGISLLVISAYALGSQEKKVFVKDVIFLAKQCSMAVKGVDFTYSALHICSIMLFSVTRL